MNIVEIILFILFILSLATCSYRLYRGPTIPDRVIAMDLFSAILMVGMMGLAWVHEERAYMAVALAIAIVGFMATVAIAVYLQKGGEA